MRLPASPAWTCASATDQHDPVVAPRMRMPMRRALRLGLIVAALAAGSGAAAQDKVAVGVLRFGASGPVLVAGGRGSFKQGGRDVGLKCFDAARASAGAAGRRGGRVC